MTNRSLLDWRPKLATRLYAAIGGAVAFVLVSSIVAWLAFVQLGEQQREIASQHLPAITHSLQLAERAAQIASIAPRLLVVDSDDARSNVIESLTALEREILGLLNLLKTDSQDDGVGAEADLTEAVRGNGQNFSSLLRELGQTEAQRAALEVELGRMTASAVETHHQLREIIVPLLDDRTFFLVTGYQSLDDQRPVPASGRLDGEAVVSFGALFDLEAEVNLMTVVLSEMGAVEDAALLTPLVERFEAARDRFSAALARADDLPQANTLREIFAKLVAVGAAESGIPDIRRRVLELRQESVAVVDESRQIASNISDNVNQIVDIKRSRSEASLAATEAIVSNGQQLLLWLNGFALAGAILISWLYIKRSFTTPVVKLTAAAEAFEQGDYDPNFLKSTSARSDELGQLATTFSSMAEEVRARTQKLDDLVAERTDQLNKKNEALAQSLERIEDELEMAQRMQVSILPKRVPERLRTSIFAEMKAARAVGGDFYDFIDLGENRLGFAIADVSDKGVPAAFMMAVCYTKLRSLALRGLSPGTVMELLNEDLSADNDSAMFVTAFYAVVDLEQGTLTYANAGHDAPILSQSAQGCNMLKSTRGVALGAMPGLTYDELSYTLRPGDTVFCYTDGITEAFNASGEAFTAGRLISLLDELGPLPPEALCAEVVHAVEKHAGGSPQSDDITCIAFRRDPEDDPLHAEGNVAEASYVVRPDLSDIAVLAERMLAFGAANGVPDATMRKINLALDELLTNTLMHGASEKGVPVITVRAQRRDNGVEVIVEDDAAAFNPLDQEAPDIGQPLEDRPVGGLGIHIVRSLIDDVAYSRTGDKNRVTLFKQIET